MVISQTTHKLQSQASFHLNAIPKKTGNKKSLSKMQLKPCYQQAVHFFAITSLHTKIRLKIHASFYNTLISLFTETCMYLLIALGKN